MVDTICLSIAKHKISFAESLLNLRLNYHITDNKDFIRNPDNLEKETGKYYPRLTGYGRRFNQEACIKIELSLPKLLYLNNLDELEDKDFGKIIKALQERLTEMGIIISKKDIRQAQVSSIHFSKNILLEDGYTCNYLISEMNKVNLNKNLDFAKVRYINDGQSLYAHATSHQFVIYDKISDLNKDKKRAIDKDQTTYQKHLFNKLSKNKVQEILRFEVRLTQKAKMNKTLESCGFKKNPLFKDIFKKEISKKVVIGYWQKLIKDKSLGVFSIQTDVKDVFKNLHLANPKIKPKQAIYLLGLYSLARDENGIRQLRTIVAKNSNDRTWYRIAKDLKDSNSIITNNKIRNWVNQIDKNLEDYTPIKIKQLK